MPSNPRLTKRANKSRAPETGFHKKIKMFQDRIARISSENVFLVSIRPGYRTLAELMRRRDQVAYTLLAPRAPKGYRKFSRTRNLAVGSAKVFFIVMGIMCPSGSATIALCSVGCRTS